jgi:hypothetical protein
VRLHNLQAALPVTRFSDGLNFNVPIFRFNILLFDPDEPASL